LDDEEFSPTAVPHIGIDTADLIAHLEVRNNREERYLQEGKCSPDDVWIERELTSSNQRHHDGSGDHSVELCHDVVGAHSSSNENLSNHA